MVPHPSPPNAACSPPGVNYKTPPPPTPGAQVRRGSALITILPFALKKHLKRVWGGPEKSTCLQKHWEDSTWGSAWLFPQYPLFKCAPTSIKETLKPVLSHLNCCIVCRMKLVLMITTLGFSIGFPKRATQKFYLVFRSPCYHLLY